MKNLAKQISQVLKIGGIAKNNIQLRIRQVEFIPKICKLPKKIPTFVV